MKILIAYGTLTMNTELVSERVFEVLKKNQDLEVEIKNLIEIDETKYLEDFDLIIFGTSTWGEGELPPDPEEFMELVLEEMPNLKNKKVAFFGLGESHYEIFCGGIKKMRDIFLNQFEMNEVTRMKLIDGYPEDHVLDDMEDWCSKLIKELQNNL